MSSISPVGDEMFFCPSKFHARRYFAKFNILISQGAPFDRHGSHLQLTRNILSLLGLTHPHVCEIEISSIYFFLCMHVPVQTRSPCRQSRIHRREESLCIIARSLGIAIKVCLTLFSLLPDSD